MTPEQLGVIKLLVRDGSYGFLGEGPTLTERAALYRAVTDDAIALRAYRILARREARIEEACGRRPVNEALLIVEANAFADDDPTLAEGL